ncbi:MAG: MFS transporter [Promethearchaeota archaeon]
MNEKLMIKRTKPALRTFLFFSLPKFGTSIMMGFADMALATLYILAYQISPILVGFALSMGKLMIAASQFLLGWLSDAKYTRWGRRKPYLIILTPVLSLSFILLLLPTLFLPLENKTALFYWLLIMYQIFNFSYGITTVSGAWMAEQFRVEDRPKAAQFEQTFSFAGTAVMAVFSMVILTNFIDQIKENPAWIPPNFSYTVIIFGLIVLVLYYLAAFFMPTEPPFSITSTMVDYLKVVLKNKNFLLVTLMIGIASLAWTQVGSLILLFTEVVLKLEATTYIMVAAIFIIGVLIFLFLWRSLIRRFGKKKSLLYDLLAAVIFLPLTVLSLITVISVVIFGILFLLGMAGIMSGWFIFQSIMVPDISEDDEKTTGELKAGTYKGFPSIPLNIFQAFGLIIMGFVLELPEITVRSSTFSLGYVLWGPICSLILLVAYFYAKKFIQLDFDWEKKNN